MLTQYQLILSPDREAKLTNESAYRLYSALLNKCPEDFGNLCHSGDRVPLSQYCIPMKDGNLLWIINLLGEYCETQLSPVIESLNSLYLRWEGCTLKAVTKEKTVIADLDELFDFGRKYDGVHRLDFISATAFKSQGKYQSLPSVRLIMQSLIRSWSSNFSEYPLDDDIIDILSTDISVQSYSLSTVKYQLKKNYITGFSGNMILKNNLTADAKLLADMLIAYSSFSGIGIKTTLGMGGVIDLTPPKQR